MSKVSMVSTETSTGSVFEQATRLQQRAAAVGFDWSDVWGVWDKVTEETAELEAALRAQDTAAIAEELGDLLFVLVNLARHCRINPESALLGTQHKFHERFAFMESQMQAAGLSFETVSLAQLEAWWQQAKQVQR